jgi:transposase
MLPQAYVYPPGMRETRDLLRRRLHLVRKRGQLLAHLQNLAHAYNRGAFDKRIAYPSHRAGVVAHFSGEPMVQANAALDLSLLDHYDRLLAELERRLVRQAKREAPSGFHLLRSIPGIGPVLAMTIVYEVHDVSRFDRVQQFASYARLVKCAKESAGKRKGTSGAKMGNVHLKWAFSEAAVLSCDTRPREALLATRA